MEPLIRRTIRDEGRTPPKCMEVAIREESPYTKKRDKVIEII